MTKQMIRRACALLAALLDRCYQDRIMAGSDSYVPRVEKEKRGEGRGRGRRKK